MARMNGCDISKWQGDIDINALPVDFVIVKATEGLGYVNPLCDNKVQQARTRGICWGFYHFATGLDAVAEADYFIKHTRNYFGKGIPVLDFEGEAIQRGAEWARLFVERVHDVTGIWPMVYMSQSITTMYDWSKVAANCALWVAQYPNVYRPDFSFKGQPPAKIGAWKAVTCWQFCSDGRIAGYDGDLDLDWFYGNADQWKAIATAGKKSPTNPPDGDNSPLVVEDDDYRVTVEKK